MTQRHVRRLVDAARDDGYRWEVRCPLEDGVSVTANRVSDAP